ncbi:hypothetical protein ACTFIV_005612 [Dictyostelium citrinum]
MFMVKQWEYPNCTGEQVEFLAFNENQFIQKRVCNNYKTMEYIKNGDYDYNKSKFCCEIKHCKLLDYNNTLNYTLLDGGKTDIFPAYVCKNSIEKITSSSRGYIVHASTIDGINDPQNEKWIIKLGLKSNNHFLNSSTSILLSIKKQ